MVSRMSSCPPANNQEVCASGRVVYVISGSDDNGIARAEELARRAYSRLLKLPVQISTPPKGGINRDLLSHIDAASMLDDFSTVIGTRQGEGGVVVSKLPEPVDFATTLTNRVANFVPVDSITDILPRVDSYCQTIGIYPESLVGKNQDQLALAGGQRLVTPGYAGVATTGFGSPQDGVEPIRRLRRACGKWRNSKENDNGTNCVIRSGNGEPRDHARS